MQIDIISPFSDRKARWLGDDKEGFRRKVFLLLDESTRSKHLVAGLTVFEPGEGSSLHSHDGSEEVNLIVKGSGTVFSQGERRAFSTMDFLFIPAGIEHRHVNDGSEPLWLFFVYSPPGQLPVR